MGETTRTKEIEAENQNRERVQSHRLSSSVTLPARIKSREHQSWYKKEGKISNIIF